MKKNQNILSKLSKIKLNITRNWDLPGKERLANMLINKGDQVQGLFFSGITWLKHEHIGIYVSTRSYIEWKIFSEGTYEAVTGNIIRMSLNPGDTALDIGANIGVHTLRMAESVGRNGRVIACEPLPHLQEKLNQNIKLNCFESWVSIIPKAISDTNGTTQMTGDPNAFNQGTARMDAHEGFEVPVITGDSLLHQLGIKSLNLIKIDVEGFEMNVIRGLKESIALYQPRIILEYDADYWEKCNSSWAELSEFLMSLKYKFYRIEDHLLTEIENTPDFTSGNIFCLTVQ